MSKISIREAFLKAANWIQKNPELYEFMACEVPACGTPGCMLGWVEHFLGTPIGTDIWNGQPHRAGVHDDEFCERIESLGFSFMGEAPGRGMPSDDSEIAAKALREYADKYHPSIERKPWADVCRGIMLRPFKESANA